MQVVALSTIAPLRNFVMGESLKEIAVTGTRSAKAMFAQRIQQTINKLIQMIKLEYAKQ